MRNAFNARKYWVVFLIGFFGGPVTGLCYMKRGLYAVLFMAAYLLVAAAAVTEVGNPEWSVLGLDIAFLLSWVYCLAITRKVRAEPDKPYAHGSVVLVLFIVTWIVAGGSYLIHARYYELFHISSDSMAPTLVKGDLRWGHKAVYRERDPERGDIVVLRTPLLPEHPVLIRRIVGLPGDSVQISHGTLIINDNPVGLEPSGMFPDQMNQAIPQFVETLPNGVRYKVLAEKRSNVFDDTNSYRVPFGTYYVLADDRRILIVQGLVTMDSITAVPAAIDSRDMDKIGFVSAKDIVGRINPQ